MSVADVWECEHLEAKIRRRTRSNGVTCYTHQCLNCGRSLREVSKNSPEVMRLADVEPFDETLPQRWKEERQTIWQERREAHQQAKFEQDVEWWARYHAYMKSDAWKLKRGKVLLRAKGQCEGCGERPPTEVHHLTYAHLGSEFLWELVAVCARCHARAHNQPEPKDDPKWEWKEDDPAALKYDYFESINRRPAAS